MDLQLGQESITDSFGEQAWVMPLLGGICWKKVRGTDSRTLLLWLAIQLDHFVGNVGVNECQAHSSASSVSLRSCYN